MKWKVGLSNKRLIKVQVRDQVRQDLDYLFFQYKNQIKDSNKFNLNKKRMNKNLPKRSISISLQRQIENYEVQNLDLIKKIKKQITYTHYPKITAYHQIPYIPQIHLSVQDMNADPIQLFSLLQDKYSEFGAVKLITPLKWNPPFSLKYAKNAITTRLQPIHKLKNGKNFQQKKQAYTLQSYQQLANQFERKYKFKFQEQGHSRDQKLENQYWNLVKGPSKEQQQQNPKKYNVTVEYAADLPSNRFGSGFPVSKSSKTIDKHFNYAENLFNLNNLYRSQNSLLKIADQRQEYIGGITIPWIYIGMIFSSFCWHVEDSSINSINYNHLGGVKTWYIIPQSDKQKFDNYVQKKYGDKSQIDKITYMIDPLQIINNNIKVFKANQQPKQYILTFFKAYHCGFSQSFNVGEATNFIYQSSLRYIKQFSTRSTRPSIFCYQWIVHENYLRNIRVDVHTVNQIIEKQFNWMLQREQNNLQKIKNNNYVKTMEQIMNTVKYDKYLCSKCKQYVYLSFLKCQNCWRCFCFTDATKCCPNSNMILMIRQTYVYRQKYISKIKKFFKKTK